MHGDEHTCNVPRRDSTAFKKPSLFCLPKKVLKEQTIEPGFPDLTTFLAASRKAFWWFLSSPVINSTRSECRSLESNLSRRVAKGRPGCYIVSISCNSIFKDGILPK